MAAATALGHRYSTQACFPRVANFWRQRSIKYRQPTSIQREKMVATLYEAATEFDATKTWKSWQKMKKGFHGKA
ncbi:hypothetical protein [Azohydromonas lata]|uniref:Transposase n=1 Tax=Azohydromonas lata TaxID=45677 RepID=A0ABU5IRE8_9BURK|nr:hypothetical protein [Azohydromonas lata]MDZ5461445.1 hypothetical protein [Azohydromonas lata]